VIQVLVSELVKISSEEEMKTLIKVLLTETEQLMIAKRVFAFVLIDQGVGNMEIARRLHFTRATVERLRVVYKHLDEANKPVKKLVKQFETSEVLRELLKKFLKYAIPAAFGKIPLKSVI
jgi:Trp operon repressor